MKIKLDKDFTCGIDAPRVKEDIKEFKGRYTDGDLLRAFREATEFWNGYCADIIECNVSAFPGGWFYNNETHFCVEITLKDAGIAFYEIRYYCDMDLTVNTDTEPQMYHIKEYRFTA